MGSAETAIWKKLKSAGPNRIDLMYHDASIGNRIFFVINPVIRSLPDLGAIDECVIMGWRCSRPSGNRSTIFHEDPAAKSVLEIDSRYPGFHAVLAHRFSHWLYTAGVPLVPRVISQISRFFTGVEIILALRSAAVSYRSWNGCRDRRDCRNRDDVLMYEASPAVVPVKKRATPSDDWENVVIGTGAKVLGNILIGERKNRRRPVVVSPCRITYSGRYSGAHCADGHRKMRPAGAWAIADPEGQALDDLRGRVDRTSSGCRGRSPRRRFSLRHSR